MSVTQRRVDKLATGITGFDFIAGGGLPRGRTTLVSGAAGSGRTIFAAQFLAEGIMLPGRGAGAQPEHGVFVTFEESPEDIRRNIASMGWDIARWEAEGRWAFVDASPQPGESPALAGSFDPGALMARIESAVNRIGAQRVSMDSLGAIFTRFGGAGNLRGEMFRIAWMLRKLGVTAMITAERSTEYGDIGRYGIEEFVTDNVIILRNALENEKRRRTLEILKFRGASHQKGEFPFSILPGRGIVVIPLSAIELGRKSSTVRITSGNDTLDRLCGGGFFRDSIILVSGATGTGKTLVTCQFIAGGVRNNERCLYFAFEESREQLFRSASGWGMDFEAMQRDGLLKVECAYPETAGLEDHLIRMRALIEEFRPARVAVDSLSALERVSSIRGFREFVIALTSFIKQQEIAGLYTSTTPSLMGGTSVTEAHISTITDLIILLRYVEAHGEMRRCLTVLKMRGSMHDKDIREFTIDSAGMRIGRPFRDISGILTGLPVQIAAEESQSSSGLFSD